MKYTWIILLLILSISCSKSTVDIPSLENISYEPKSSGEIVKHTYYLAYSEENEEAFWVYYQ